MVEMKDLSNTTLGQFKDKVLIASTDLCGKSIIIEFNSNIIYEFDQELDPADEDDTNEIKMNENRLKK